MPEQDNSKISPQVVKAIGVKTGGRPWIKIILIAAILGASLYGGYFYAGWRSSKASVSIPQEEAGKGEIEVNSVPDGANIEFDGVNTGKKTPSVLKDISSGNHRMVFSKGDDYFYSQIEVDVKKDEKTTVVVYLVPKSGEQKENGNSEEGQGVGDAEMPEIVENYHNDKYKFNIGFIEGWKDKKVEEGKKDDSVTASIDFKLPSKESNGQYFTIFTIDVLTKGQWQSRIKDWEDAPDYLDENKSYVFAAELASDVPSDLVDALGNAYDVLLSFRLD